MLSLEHFVECLLQAFAAFGFRPESFVIVDNAIEVSAGSAGVADNLPARLSRSDMCGRKSGATSCPSGFLCFDFVTFGLRQVLRDLQRKNAAVVVMPENRLIRDFDLAIDQFLGAIRFSRA